MRLSFSRNSFLFSALFMFFCSLASQSWAAPVATTTTLAITSGGNTVASGGSVASGSEVTLTASVVSGTTSLTTGQVKFCDTSATYCTDIHLLGTAQLTSAGSATFRLHPGIGSRGYKAIFAGTPNGATAYAGSTSGVSSLTITGTFPTTTTIAASGSVGNYSLTATVTGQVNAVGIAAPASSVSFLDTTDNNFSLGTAELAAGTEAFGFVNSSTPSANRNPQAIAVADFNGDGKPDLFVSTYSSPTVLLGNGDGTFSTGPAISLPSSESNNAAVADFNGDGNMDVAVSLPDASQIVVLLGNGDGSFTEMPPIPAPGVSSVAVGDFNGDGKPDLLFADAGNWEIVVLLGKGDGTFAAPTPTPIAVISGEPQIAAIGDFNGDGILDVATTDFPYTPGDPGSGTDVPGAVTILIGKGDGTFTAMPEAPATGFSPLDITTGDFNGDGILDLAVANLYSETPEEEPGTVTVLLGNGDGTFKATAISPTTGFLPHSVRVGDFNGDGKADLVTANEGDNSLTVLLGNGDGTFAAPLSLPIGSNSIFAAVADFNGDGLSDLAAANNAPNYTVTVQLSQLTRTSTATATGISILGTGTHQVDASYPGDSLYSASTSATTPLTAQQVKPAVAVTPSSASITTAQALSVTVAVSGGTGNPTPTGSITLTSGSYTSAVATLSGGDASITIPAGSLAAGSATLTATYAGDPNYTAATGTASVTVTAGTFAITGTAVTVAAGASTGNTSIITLTPVDGFTGNVALTATATTSPSGSTLPPTFSFGTTTPVSITGAAAGTATLTISTTAASTTPCTVANQMPRGIPGFAGSEAVLACLFLFGIPARRRRLQSILAILLLLGALGGGLVACGGGGSPPCSPVTTPGTTAGTYTITVTGTSGSLTETGTVTLTVQ